MVTFNTISRWSKAWILAAIASLMLFDLYWIRGVYTRIYSILLENLPNITAKYYGFYLDYVAGGIADTLRLIAVILLFVAAFLAWGPKKKPFASVKNLIAVPILFEGIYWLAILPFIISKIARGLTPTLLYVGFIVQIVTVGPLLVILSYKIWRYKVGARNDLIKWGIIAGIGYIFGILINNLLKWFGMSGERGLLDLFTGVSTWGFLNTAITCTLALVLAIAGFCILMKGSNRKLTARLLGAAISLFGLYFILFIAYSWFAPGAWAFVMLTEIWPASLLGVGIGVVLKGKV